MLKKLCTQLKKKNRGFTLIELIVVIGILAILAALAIPAVAGYLENSKARTNVSNAKIIHNAAQAYLAANPGETTVAMSDLTASTAGYLASEPKTAEGLGYTLSSDGAGVSWVPETTLVIEDPSADATDTAPGNPCIYPGGATMADPDDGDGT